MVASPHDGEWHIEQDPGQPKMWVLRDTQGQKRCAMNYNAALHYWNIHNKDPRIEMESMTRLKNVIRPPFIRS